jgi:hypothetical protein
VRGCLRVDRSLLSLNEAGHETAESPPDWISTILFLKLSTSALQSRLSRPVRSIVERQNPKLSTHATEAAILFSPFLTFARQTRKIKVSTSLLDLPSLDIMVRSLF